MTIRYYILSGRGEPLIIQDEEGRPASFASEEAARDCAKNQMLCQASGFCVLAWDDEGLVDVEF